MSSLLNATEAAQTAAAPPPETKIEPPITSRAYNNPDLWEEARQFSEMLTYCRPDKSRTESKFIARYLVPLGVDFDKHGNIYKQVGKDPIVLWSSHTDTVHSVKGFQKIEYWFDKKTGDLNLQNAPKPKSSCLGADDTAGIWLMLQMIKANVPGLYIFHRGEEVGRKGSKWIAEHNKDALKGIRFAIAFDRKGEKSIITYQTSKRCCSDEFAKSLADQLGMGHECDTGGSYTDTASYVDIVPECTNVSVGYERAHCYDEYTNVDYLLKLRDAVCKIDVTKLVEKRKPGENTRLYSSYTYVGEDYYGEFWGHHYSSSKSDSESKDKDNKSKIFRGGLTGLELRKMFKNDNWMRYYDYDSAVGLWFPCRQKKDIGVTKGWVATKPDKKSNSKPTYLEAIRMVKQNPEVIYDLLESLGFGPSEIQDHLFDTAAIGQNIVL